MQVYSGRSQSVQVGGRILCEQRKSKARSASSTTHGRKQICGVMPRSHQCTRPTSLGRMQIALSFRQAGISDATGGAEWGPPNDVHVPPTCIALSSIRAGGTPEPQQ